MALVSGSENCVEDGFTSGEILVGSSGFSVGYRSFNIQSNG